MKYSHHTGLLIVSTIVMIVVYGVYAYAYVFIDRSVDKALEGRVRVATEKLYQSQEREITELYDRSVADRTRVGSFFVSEDQAVSFIETLEALGSQAGSTISLSSIESVAPIEGQPGSIRTRVEARGSWSAVMKTLMLAEAAPYNVSISQVRLDSSGGTDPKAKSEWRVNFALQATLTYP